MYTMNQWTLIGFTGQDAENSLHAKRKARNHAVGRHQRILEERGGCLAEPFRMAPVVLFGPLAEYARTLAKGSLVLVQGAARSREYDKGRGEAPRVRSSRRDHRQARPR